VSVPTVSLPNGDELPAVGLGTWNLNEEEAARSVRAALDAGYTHVDTAEGYGNEAAVGEVLTEYDRDDVFLTSKVLPKHLDYESVIASCKASLERLGTDYLDLYLVHWPNPAISVRETMNAMATLRETGRVHNVGVSNFSGYQLSAAQHVADIPIAVNQVEYHPWNTQDDIVEYCRKTDTVIEAAAPLARGEVFEDSAVRAVAEENDRPPAQVVLKWAVENGIVVLPKSTNPGHIRANLDLFNWDLAPEDKERIDNIDRHQPVYDFLTRDWSQDTYGIAE